MPNDLCGHYAHWKDGKLMFDIRHSVIRHSFVIRSFVIRHLLEVIA